jgi:hypothetical protein
MPHLLVDISGHGFGHVAQTAAVLNDLTQRLPELRLTVRSSAPAALLRERIRPPFDHLSSSFDFGMRMADAMRVDVAATLADYRELHADWDARVAREAATMQALAPDLLLANIPYLSLAAAHAAGIPAVALCCLNWADIYDHFSPDDAESAAIHRQMQSAYADARCFLQIAPTMPMPDLPNRHTLGVVAELGKPRRDLLDARFGASTRRVLVSMGGIEKRLPMENWPVQPGVVWLVPQRWGIQRADIAPFESLGLGFSDLLASCDAIVTKPGYGTFSEAACNGVPVLYLAREDWPEAPYLVAWLEQNGRCRELPAERLENGEVGEYLEELWATPAPPAPLPEGVAQAAKYLLEQLRG